MRSKFLRHIFFGAACNITPRVMNHQSTDTNKQHEGTWSVRRDSIAKARPSTTHGEGVRGEAQGGAEEAGGAGALFVF